MFYTHYPSAITPRFCVCYPGCSFKTFTWLWNQILIIGKVVVIKCATWYICRDYQQCMHCSAYVNIICLIYRFVFLQKKKKIATHPRRVTIFTQTVANIDLLKYTHACMQWNIYFLWDHWQYVIFEDFYQICIASESIFITSIRNTFMLITLYWWD